MKKNKQIAEDIKDEAKGHKHYVSMAKKIPSAKKSFTSMAKDEAKHKKMLKKIKWK